MYITAMAAIRRKSSPLIRFYLSYMFSDDRKPIYYKEKSHLKIFFIHVSKFAHIPIRLLDPFIATFVRVHLTQIVQQVQFTIHFYGNKAVWHKTDEFHLISKSVTTDFNFNEHIVFTFGKKALISGIRFDDVKVLQEFKLSYETGNKVFSYKDNVLQDVPTIFRVKLGVVGLRSFVAESVTVVVLKSRKLGFQHKYFSIHLIGKKGALDSYHYPNIYNSDGEENYGGEPVYSNLLSALHVQDIYSSAKTNYLGPDCFTRPQFCDSGFSVKFNAKGGLRNINTYKHNQTKAIAAIFGEERDKQAFGFDADNKTIVSRFLFHMDHKFSFINLLQVWLEADIIQCPSHIPGSMNIYPVGNKSKLFDYSISTTLSISIANNFIRYKRIAIQDSLLKEKLKHLMREDLMLIPYLIFEFVPSTSAIVKTNCTIKNLLLMFTFQGRDVKNTEIIKFKGNKKYTMRNKYALSQTVVVKALQFFGSTGAVSLTTFYEDGNYTEYYEVRKKNSKIILRFPTVLRTFQIICGDSNGVFVLHGKNMSYSETLYYPIISSGFSGDKTQFEGTGFTAYMKDTSLNVIVCTPSHQWHVEKEIERAGWIFQAYIITWDKQNLTVFEDGQIIATATNSSLSETAESIPGNEYFTFLKRYDFFMRTCHLQIFHIRFFRYPLNKTEDEYEFSNQPIIYSKVVTKESKMQPWFFPAPNCSCKDEVCPCDIKNSDKIRSLFTHVSGSLYDVTSHHVDLITALYSNNILVDNSGNKFLLLSIQLNLPFKKSWINETFMTLQYVNKRVERLDASRQCMVNNDLVSAKLIFEKSIQFELKREMVVDAYTTNVMNLKISFANCFQKMDENIKGVKLSIAYLINDESGFVTYANDESGHPYKIFIIQLFPYVRCVSFKYKFHGRGFVFVSVLSRLHNGHMIELKRLYLNDFTPNFGEIQLTVFQQLTRDLKVVLLKRKINDGFFMLYGMKQYISPCTTLDHSSRNTQVACEDKDVVSIGCPSSMQIKIKKIFFGRVYGYTHPCDVRRWAYYCDAGSSYYEKVRNDCDGKINCSIVMNLTDTSCKNKPYIQVEYQCDEDFVVTDFEELQKKLVMLKFPIPSLLYVNDNSELKVLTKYVTSPFNETKFPRWSWWYDLPLGFQAIDNSLINFTVNAFKDVSLITISLWFHNVNAKYPVFQITGDGDVILKIVFIKNQRFRLDGCLGNGTIIMTNYIGWYHLVITYNELRQHTNVYLNSEIQLSNDPIPFNISGTNYHISLLNVRVYCIQIYETTLDYFEIIQTSVCPTRFSSFACGEKPSGCSKCNQYTSEITFAKNLSQMWQLNCLHGSCVVFSRIDYHYYNFDFIGDSLFLPVKKKELYSFPFNESIMELTYGVINNALCFNDEFKSLQDAIFECHPGKTCYFGYWLKHYCGESTKYLIMATSYFTLMCGRNNYSADSISIELITRKVAVCFDGKSSFWYHLFFGVESNSSVVNVHIDGVAVTLQECNTNEVFIDRIEFSVGKMSNLCIDEFFATAEDYSILQSKFTKLFESYTRGLEKELSTARQHFLPYHFILNLKKTEYNEKMADQSSDEYHELSEKIKSALLSLNLNNADFFLNPNELQFYRHPIRREEAFLEIYARKMDMEIYTELLKLSINEDENRLTLYPVYNRLDAMAMLFEAVSDIVVHVIEVVSDKATIKYELSKSHYHLPIHGLYLACKEVRIESNARHHSKNYWGYSINYQPPQHYEVNSTKDLIQCRNLRAHTTYSVCVLPVPLAGTMLSIEHCHDKASFITSGHAPKQPPTLLFAPNVALNLTQVSLGQISFWSWTCIPGGYFVHYILHANLVQYGFTPENVIGENLQKYFQNVSLAINLWSQYISFDLQLKVYRSYTFIAYPFCAYTMWKGERSVFTIRSQPGAPDNHPSNLNLFIDNNKTKIYWDVTDDLDFWNSDEGSDWKVVIYMTYNFGNIRRLETLYNASFDFENDNSILKFGIIMMNASSQNIYGESNQSPSSCVIIPVTTIPHNYFTNETVIRISNSSVTVSFEVTNVDRYLGKKKYLAIAVFELFESDGNLSLPLSSYDTYSVDNNLYPSYTNDTSFLTIYYKQIHFDIDIEKETNKVISCDNISLYYQFKSQKVIINNLTIHELKAYKNYSMFIYPCNEFGCNMAFSLSNSYLKLLFETSEYKPSASPRNITIRIHGKYAFISWDEIEDKQKNGVILGYNIKLTRYFHEKDVTEFNVTQMSITKEIGKYVKFCIQLAGFTSHQEMGTYSDILCNTTQEFVPDIIPDMQIVEATSSSFKICFKKLLAYETNGILRYVVTNHNSTNSTYIENVHKVNQSLFSLNAKHPYCFHVKNLSSFMVYEMKFTFVTIGKGNWSHLHVNRTNIGVPAFSPDFQFNTSSTTCLLRWEKLSRHLWNAPSIFYKIILKNSSAKDLSFFEVDGTKSFYEITNLKPYRKYNASLSACSSKQCGDPISHSFTTNESEPCAPTDIGVFKNVEIGIYINWSSIPSDCENGIIIAYTINIYELDDEGNVASMRTDTLNDTTVMKYLITHVSFGKLYNISVSGKTIAGVGDKTKWLSLSRGRLVHGSWSSWKEWSICSESCGNSYQKRKRYCNEPIPVNGRNCSGNATELKECFLEPCPGMALASHGDSCTAACQYLGFACSKEINEKQIVKSLECTIDPEHIMYTKPFQPAYDGKNCHGIHSLPEKLDCNATIPKDEKSLQRICNCVEAVEKYMTVWSAWTLCDTKCGFNVAKKRTRQCNATESICKTAKTEQELPCISQPCPIDGGWSNWSPYTSCDQPCGGGMKRSYRQCDNPEPKYGGEDCIGNNVITLDECNPTPCKVNGGWTIWSELSVCRQPCGNATKIKHRKCTNPIPEHGGMSCQGNDTQISVCIMPSCVQLSFILEFHLAMVFKFQFYYLTSEESKYLETILCKAVVESISNITHLISCTLIRIRKSSVIGEVLLKFQSVEQEQLVQLSDMLNNKDYIGNFTMKKFRFYSDDLPCEPPENIETSVVNKTSVFVRWDLPECLDKQDILYVYLAFTPSNNVDKNTRWEIVGVPSHSKNELLLARLQPDVLYKGYMMQARFEGNGVPSSRFFFQTPSFSPSVYPKDVRSVSISSMEIFVSWKAIEKKDEQKALTGYKIRYRKYSDNVMTQEKIVAPSFTSTTIEELKPFTLYIFHVLAFNEAGDGPANSCTGKTLEGVPSVAVPNVRIKDMQSVDWWSVKWGEITKSYTNGILRGYRLRYYLSYRSDKPVGGEIERIVRSFDNTTFYYKAVRLLNYATYNVSVTGYTSAGDGPIEEHFARTCKCRKYLYANWFEYSPYTLYRPQSPKTPMQSNKELQGIFPSVIHDILVKACGKCGEDYKQSRIFYYVSKNGEDPNRKNQFQLKLDINDEVDVSFPFYDRINRGIVVPGSVFVPLVTTPGCAFIVRDEVDLNAIVVRLVLAIVNVWPLLIVSYGIATLFGILIWFADQFSNPDEFSLGSAIKGPCIGFWFSFVTMTTVGYGDVAPRSIGARNLSIAWCLTGLVLNGIIIGYITTSLTSLQVPQQSSLYNTKVAALNESYELSYAIRRNANLSETRYLDIEHMLDDLSEKKVDVVLVDMYSLVNYSKVLNERKLKLQAILKTETGYGLVLSGFSYTLQYDVESLIYSQNDMLTKYTESIKESIPEIWDGDEKSVSELVFGADSEFFRLSVIYMVITWSLLAFIGLFYDVIYFLKRRRKIQAEDEYGLVYEKLCKFVATFQADMCSIIHTKTLDQEKELFSLVVYRENLQRHNNRIGLYRT